MSATPNLDALLKAVSATPQRWRMLKRTPAFFGFCECAPDDRGGEWLELNPANIRALAGDIGRSLSGVASKDSNGFAWLRRDGANLFDPPDAECAAHVARSLFSAANHPAPFARQLFQQMANGYMLAQWIARQHGVIGAESWGACFMAAWVSQNGSMHLSIDLPEPETTAMFAAMGELGGLYWNSEIKSRADLPETVRLHRGIATNEAPGGGFLGYSWSDDFAAAGTYATRRSQQGMGRAQVVSATFDRSDIAAVFEHHGGKAGRTFKEWLIYPNAQPKAIERQLVVFDLFSFSYRAQPVQRQEGRLAA